MLVVEEEEEKFLGWMVVVEEEEEKFLSWMVVVEEEGYQLEREGKSEKGGWEGRKRKWVRGRVEGGVQPSHKVFST